MKRERRGDHGADGAAGEEEAVGGGPSLVGKRAAYRLRGGGEGGGLGSAEQHAEREERRERDRERVRAGDERPHHDGGREATPRAEPVDHDAGDRRADEVGHREGAHEPAVLAVIDDEGGPNGGGDRGERLPIDVAYTHPECGRDGDRPGRAFPAPRAIHRVSARHARILP